MERNRSFCIPDESEPKSATPWIPSSTPTPTPHQARRTRGAFLTGSSSSQLCVSQAGGLRETSPVSSSSVKILSVCKEGKSYFPAIEAAHDFLPPAYPDGCSLDSPLMLVWEGTVQQAQVCSKATEVAGSCPAKEPELTPKPRS